MTATPTPTPTPAPVEASPTPTPEPTVAPAPVDPDAVQLIALAPDQWLAVQIVLCLVVVYIGYRLVVSL